MNVGALPCASEEKASRLETCLNPILTFAHPLETFEIMLHLLYFIAFTTLAVLAVSNMIRNVVNLGTQARQPVRRPERDRPAPHPELLDNEGNAINEPLLVMRSISIKDARDRLDALYDSSSSSSNSASSSSDDAQSDS